MTSMRRYLPNAFAGASWVDGRRAANGGLACTETVQRLRLVLNLLLWLGAGVSLESSTAWESHAGYRCRDLRIKLPGRTCFSQVTPEESGVKFTNLLSDQLLQKDSTLLGGSGVALGDVDGDGLCDIYFCSLAGRNALYRNLGNWRFEEITDRAGVACAGQISRGAVFADVNGDGALDLLVTAKGGGTRLFINDGKGVFHETTADWGLATNTGSTSLALADVDGNGTLDLYVANFGKEMVLREGGSLGIRMVNGKPMVKGRFARKVRIINNRLVEFGEPDVLYLNDGKGRFEPVPWEQGAFLDEQGKPVETPWDFGLAVQMRDLNGDGWPDIYVCNDFFTPDRIWMNDRKGHFRAIDRTAIRKLSFASMAVDFADIDRDGYMDAFIVEMLARDPAMRLRDLNIDLVPAQVVAGGEDRPQTGRNTLLLNRGDGTFAEIAHYAGLTTSDWSWTPVFMDVDLDGFEDLLIGNGPTYDLMYLDRPFMTPGQDARSSGRSPENFPRINVPNCAFRNNGDRTFSECAKQWGFDSLAACTGIALADLDGDGDLDVVVNCLNGPALLYRNESAAPRVAVRLKGTPPNTQGIGALVTVRGGAVAFQSQEIIAGGRYLSGDEAMRVFAAGTPTNRLTIEVAWRSGKHSLISNALPNRLYEIDEPSATPAPPTQETPTSHMPGSAASGFVSTPLFADASATLGHVHHEVAFDDFGLQPLLPKRLSQLGPGAAWADLDGDGREELVIGNGRNGPLAVYRWDGKGSFKPVRPAQEFQFSGDSAGLSSCVLGGRRALLMGQSNYEAGGKPVVPVLTLSARSASAPLEVGAGLSNLDGVTVGPMAVADLDGDGELEVFVGGRVSPGKYPQPVSSFILRTDKEELRVDPKLSEALKGVGLVSGAVFSDLDGDGLPELILACEWGPLRVFKFVNGHLKELTQQLGLGEYTGWWQSVTTGDLDGDGRLDIIAGNWGLNSRYQAGVQHPLVCYYGDFNDDGRIVTLESCYDLTGTRLLSGRHLPEVAGAMPFLLPRFTNNASFSEATIQEVLGARLSRATKVSVSTLSSMVFFNRGDHFEGRPLPAEAQWAPVFGISAADFDGDGNEDILLAQNFFDLPTAAWRQDAGRGLLLRGDGAGGLRPVPAQCSGLRIYGEQRGCAVADYDEDGRLDAVVCQNGAPTQVLHNVGATPGLRIRLQGPPGNPDAIGAVLRLEVRGQFGPAREIHAGSGYWSQDSVVQVMSPQTAQRLWIRWPGGNLTTNGLPAAAREVRASPDGTVQRIK